MKITETFNSIQGEGVHAGKVYYFVRLYGCNLDCSWCDQPSALTTRGVGHFREMESEEVVQTILPHPIEVPVCFTGGEPCFQPNELIEVVRMLREQEGFDRLVTIETNGTIFIKELANDPHFFLTCSPKFQATVTDGKIKAHGQKEIEEWIASQAYLLRNEPGMQLKFVVEDEEWFERIIEWLKTSIDKEQRPYIPVIFQPEWFKGREKFTALVKKYSEPENYAPLAKLKFKEIGFQTQMHKIIHIR